MKKIENEHGNEQPLTVEAISQLDHWQGRDFWMRELCIQIAALREELQEQLRLLRDAITMHP